MELDERPPTAAPAATPPAGRMTISPATGPWSWSDEMFALHGMRPGEVVPTRALFLRHVHADDQSSVEQVLEAATVAPAGCEYRLVDLAGRTRTIVVALDTRPDGTVTGLLVDVTVARNRAVSELVNAQLAAALESRTVIDQAKGVLMTTFGVDDQVAFACLALISQYRNVRLRMLAEQVLSAAVAGTGTDAPLFAQIEATLDVLAARSAGEKPSADAGSRD